MPKGTLAIAFISSVAFAAPGGATPAAVHCAVSGGSPVIDVGVQAPGPVSAVRVFYRFEDGRDASAEMVRMGGGRYTARLPYSPLGTAGLSYRIVAESSFTTAAGVPVQSTQLVAEAAGCGSTLRDIEPVAVPATPAAAPPALAPPQVPSVPVLDEGPATPDVDKAPDLPPHPPTGGDPRSPPR